MMTAHETIQTNGLRVLHIFPVLDREWDADNEGYIVEDPATAERRILLTRNEVAFWGTPERLREMIAEYRSAISETERALALTVKPSAPEAAAP